MSRNATNEQELAVIEQNVEPLEQVRPHRSPENAMGDLLRMLRWRRPGDSNATLKFAKHWLKPIGAKMDARGNWFLRIDKNGKRGNRNKSRMLWSSHIDTCHGKEGYQFTRFNPTSGFLTLADHENQSSCLGADCTTGVWLMREMVMANIPGLYIWHEAEESGGAFDPTVGLAMEQRGFNREFNE